MFSADRERPNGLESKSNGVLPPDEVVFGRGAAMRAVRATLEKLVGAREPVLLLGKGGTGKELIARWIHANSPWSDKPFVKVNCAAIPGTLLESELYGYEKGAFTGAVKRKLGRVELADGGTLFLDEIAEIELGLQAKLLQFLQDGRFSRIGDEEERRVQTRIICATSRDLARERDEGRFRADLFYRMNVLPVRLPRLRERPEDIRVIANYFVETMNIRFGKSSPPLAEEMIRGYENHDWPGNIRELENRIGRYVILGGQDFGEVGKSAAVLPAVVRARREGIPMKKMTELAVREAERALILQTLQTYHWNRRRTAEALKISYRALIYKLKDAGVSSRRQTTGNGNNRGEPNGKPLT